VVRRADRDGHPGWAFVPVVLGPDSVPVVTEPDRARQDPELAVLSALAHGGEDVGETVAALRSKQRARSTRTRRSFILIWC